MKPYIALLLIFLLAIGCTSEYVGGTTVTPHMEEKITPGKSLLYCSTFQIAWNELKDNIVKEDIRLTDEPPIVPFLNKSLSTKGDISEDCYVAMVGFGKDDIVAEINKALREKFGEEAPVIKEPLGHEHALAYAYLYKNLEFKLAFESLKDPISFTSSDGQVTKVRAFGIKKHSDKERHIKIAKQIEILNYKDTSDFIIRLKSASPKDEIILAKVKLEETLLETIKAVATRVEKASPVSLDRDDTLQIPKFEFDLEHSYSELLGKHLKNKGFEGYWIAKAIQSIRFKLSEKGVVLKSEARIILESARGMEQPKRLIFDRPFLIYLKEKGARYPYFALWVDNAELMVRE